MCFHCKPLLRAWESHHRENLYCLLSVVFRILFVEHTLVLYRLMTFPWTIMAITRKLKGILRLDKAGLPQFRWYLACYHSFPPPQVRPINKIGRKSLMDRYTLFHEQELPWLIGYFTRAFY
ncbi:hypothetical protein Patl1_07067 [Pistacia atlantica]|uniref:Uncharacterized protein n=1 Tax=Pistacia atlantica TaxID=434234 RepID=A0ACC1AE03_9ROSI|nr:hypothetical protein Patl1_07067 [Pistacia atlantica]